MSKGKVKNSSLCFSCQHSVIAENESGRCLIVCQMISRRIYDPIVNCNSYEDKAVVRENDLKEIAWIIDPKKKGKIGFMPPEKKEHIW